VAEGLFKQELFILKDTDLGGGGAGIDDQKFSHNFSPL
jgi:hypothetical protein